MLTASALSMHRVLLMTIGVEWGGPDRQTDTVVSTRLPLERAQLPSASAGGAGPVSLGSAGFTRVLAFWRLFVMLCYVSFFSND